MNKRSAGDSLVEILQLRATQQPDKKCHTFLLDGEKEAGSLTFHELDRQARLIAVTLQSIGAPGERAILMYPSGLEYVAAFCSCLYAGIIAVPVYPPRPKHKFDRWLAIIQDCRPSMILTTAEIGRHLAGLLQEMDQQTRPHLIDTDRLLAINDVAASSWKKPEISSNTIAFLQYTSGSTSAPRGVMVSHRNLVHNQGVMQEVFDHTEDTIIVSWLPIYHDMGLIGTILPPIFAGSNCVFMSPAAFIQRPVRWLEAFSRYRGTFTAAPNFAYDLCVARITADQKATLDLRSWKYAVNGSEPVRVHTVHEFNKAFAECGLGATVLRPSYGLAEATLLASTSRRKCLVTINAFDASLLKQNCVDGVREAGENRRLLVSCGEGVSDQQIIIADPDTLTASPPEEVGEIWLRGPSMAQGYWDRPELSQSTFNAYLSDTQQGPFLRTGDMGFLHKGELYITGRRKDLIILNGLNHYPQDIEFTVEASHPAIRPGCGAAFSVESEGGERLVIVYELKPSHLQRTDLEEVAERVREAVALEHELHVDEVEFVRPLSIPKTSSGKIQRNRCREKFLEGSLDKVREKEPAPDPMSNGHTPALFIGGNGTRPPMQFSLFYFSSQDAGFQPNKYRLLLEGAKFADEHNFVAVWVPERHFHAFGGIYPNPSVLASALAVSTKRIRIRAGSVVLPLHNPIRVAEEWATVDNLSGGRVDLAFARGWNANDFALAPENYPKAVQVLYQNLDTVRKLWRGDSIAVPNGNGKEMEIKIHPLPQQRELPVWITCSGGVDRFKEAGAGGWNILTALLFQSVEELSEKIQAYRTARAKNGHNPASGHVTLMLHTFLGTNADEVKDKVRGPFTEYLKSSFDLWRHGWQDLNGLTEDQREELLNVAFERYYQTSLFGTPQSCFPLIEKFEQAGVNEIACLIDFGIETDAVLNGLHALHWLQQTGTSNGFTGSTAVSRSVSGLRAGHSSNPSIVRRHKPAPAESGAGSVQPESQIINTPASHIRATIISEIAKAIQKSPEQIAPDKHFLALGINSLKSLEIIETLQEHFAVKLEASLLFEWPTVDRLTEALGQRLSQQASRPDPEVHSAPDVNTVSAMAGS